MWNSRYYKGDTNLIEREYGDIRAITLKNIEDDRSSRIGDHTCNILSASLSASRVKRLIKVISVSIYTFIEKP